MNRSSRVGAGFAVVSMLCVQLGLAVSVDLVGRLGAGGTAWLRLAWAGLVLLVVVRPPLRSFTSRALSACVLLGLVTAGLTLLFMEAVARIPLGTASALEFLGPLAVATARGRGRARLWALLAAVGVVLLTEPWHGSVNPGGIAFALAAAVCWACYILLTQQVGEEVTGLRGLAVSMPVAGLVTTAVVLPSDAPAVLAALDGRLLLVGLGLAVLLPVVPFSLELLALRRLSTAAFGTLMALEPAIASVVGLTTLGQTPGWSTVAGSALVVAAGVGAERTGAHAPDRQPRSDAIAATPVTSTSPCHRPDRAPSTTRGRSRAGGHRRVPAQRHLTSGGARRRPGSEPAEGQACSRRALPSGTSSTRRTDVTGSRAGRPARSVTA